MIARSERGKAPRIALARRSRGLHFGGHACTLRAGRRSVTAGNDTAARKRVRAGSSSHHHDDGRDGEGDEDEREHGGDDEERAGHGALLPMRGRINRRTKHTHGRARRQPVDGRPVVMCDTTSAQPSWILTVWMSFLTAPSYHPDLACVIARQ